MTRTRLMPAAALALLAPVAAARAEGLSLDLNRLEPAGGACRITMVVANERPAPVEALKADLVMFDGKGVVARRLAVELGPVAAAKTVVKTFEVPQTACEAIGSVLLNDVPVCRLGADAPADCLAALALSSRAGPRFFK